MDDISKESVFNEAALKMRRIDDSWQVINILRTNLLDWNGEFNKWNYEIVISQLITSLYETFGKMKIEEKKFFDKSKEEIMNLLEFHPTYQKKTIQSLSGTKTILVFNKDNWKVLRKKINSFENFCREQQEVHGFSGSSRRDANKSIIDM